MGHNDTPPWVTFREEEANALKVYREAVAAARERRKAALKLSQGRPPGRTAEAYLQICETAPESEIAKNLGVSRQRVNQLKQRFWLCSVTAPHPRKVKGNWQVCPKCGGKKSRSGAACRACSRVPRLELVCPICGRTFRRTQAELKGARLYCSQSCNAKGKWKFGIWRRKEG